MDINARLLLDCDSCQFSVERESARLQVLQPFFGFAWAFVAAAVDDDKSLLLLVSRDDAVNYPRVLLPAPVEQLKSAISRFNGGSHKSVNPRCFLTMLQKER